eukprot:364915-Chlamydomonas_euryale.AAC.21
MQPVWLSYRSIAAAPAAAAAAALSVKLQPPRSTSKIAPACTSVRWRLAGHGTMPASFSLRAGFACFSLNACFANHIDAPNICRSLKA